jgi:hypothetical protein
MCPESLPVAGWNGPGPIRPREAPRLSSHLNYRNYCAIISRALISSRQGEYMLNAARASVPHATAPPSPNQSLVFVVSYKIARRFLTLEKRIAAF